MFVIGTGVPEYTGAPAQRKQSVGFLAAARM